MNVIDINFYPELREQAFKAVRISMEMEVDGHPGPWVLGPLCTRDHAVALEDLKKVMKEFMAVVCDPEVKTSDYCRLKQAVHSQLKHAP